MSFDVVFEPDPNWSEVENSFELFECAFDNFFVVVLFDDVFLHRIWCCGRLGCSRCMGLGFHFLFRIVVLFLRFLVLDYIRR